MLEYDSLIALFLVLCLTEKPIILSMLLKCIYPLSEVQAYNKLRQRAVLARCKSIYLSQPQQK